MDIVIKRKMILRLLTIFVLMCGLYGCFQEIVQTRDPLPDIVWPKSPEISRIRFINSISGPEDLNIRESFSKKVFDFFSGEGSVSLANPYGITKDADGRLYVVDVFNKFIHVFDMKENRYYTFPKKPSFTTPIDIAIDNKGMVYVSDSTEGVVKVFANNGAEYIKELGKGLLNRPTGLAFNQHSEELLVVDTKNSEIVRYDINTHRIKGIFGREGNTKGFFYNPTNIFTSTDGRIFVSDSLNFRVQVMTHDGKFIRTFGGAGDSPGFFSRPKGVAVDSDGNIYVVDALFDNVQIFNEQGKLLMDFGGPGSGYGQFWLPSCIYIDANNTIYISDSYNNRIQVFQYMNGDEFIK